MFSLHTLVSLFLLAIPKIVYADTCVAFDVDFNLLAFGFGGKDWNAGQQDTWATGSATDITASGRPPFDGKGTTCYLAQFFNAIYVLNGDASNPSSISIYDAAAKSWSTQTVNTGKFDPSSFVTVLDHDTNVFYAISHNELYSLEMDEKKAADSAAAQWNDVQTTPYGDNYTPVVALAQNHMHFINVPGTPAGSANIFVIHFSFFQPDAQPYPGIDGSSSFPATHGQTASFFQSEGVQQEFAFIPDDGSNTYVINVENNSTLALAGPTSKDAKAQYAASITALVQLDSTGAVSFIPYKQGDVATNAKAAWSSVAKIAAVASAGTPSSTGSSGANSTGASSANTRTPTSSSGSGSAAGTLTPTGAADSNNGALSNAINLGGIAGVMFAVLASLH